MKTEILYEDRDLLVVWKPSGLATQTARAGQADVVSELKNHLTQTGGRKGQPYLGIVHRLDQPVEGLLVFAKNKSAAAALTKQLGGEESSELMNKEYRAVLCGKPPREEGELVDYICKGADGKAKVADGSFEEGNFESRCAEAHKGYQEQYRRAVLRYQVRGTVSVSPDLEISLADIRIETGRFHQIRAQMAKAGTPILGDFKYGGESFAAYGERLGVRAAALCACRIELKHPVTGKNLRFERKPESRAFSFFEPSP